MNVIWDSETTKNIGKFVSEELDDQDLKKNYFSTLATIHRNTLRSLLLGKPSITFETVLKGLLALEVSIDDLLLEIFPYRIIRLKNQIKKEKYIKSVVHYLKNQSISRKEFDNLVNQYWEEPQDSQVK